MHGNITVWDLDLEDCDSDTQDEYCGTMNQLQYREKIDDIDIIEDTEDTEEMEQVQETDTKLEYFDEIGTLRETLQNLTTAYDKGVENYEELMLQGETINNINKKFKKMDGTLDVAETKIGEMEHPWRIGVRKVKTTPDTITPIPDYEIEGKTWKYNSILRNWYWASYIITDDTMTYDGLMKMGRFVIDLKRSTLRLIEKGIRFHNGGKSRYDTFEIKENKIVPKKNGKDKEKIVYHIFKFIDRDEMHNFVTMMKGIMPYDDTIDEYISERENIDRINEESEKKIKEEKIKNELLTEIINQLDNLDDLSKRTGHLAEHQTTQLKQLGGHAGKIDKRLFKDNMRIKRL